MDLLYHGSSEHGLTKLEPHQSTHGNYVYATPYKELAIIFSGKAGDDMIYSIFRNSQTEPWCLVERIPNGFDSCFNNSSSLYTLKCASFQNINTGFAEVVSKSSVNIINEEKIENVLEKLQELDNNGLIKIYHYPNKPKSIPQDDSDLIDKEFKQADRENRNISRKYLERLLLLHPHLLEKINEKAVFRNSEFIPFQKEDIINIFEKFVFIQMINPYKEQFLKSSFSSITNAYPELTPALNEKITIFNKTKSEKISIFIEKLFSNLKDLIPKMKNKYLNDNRKFSVIGKEIFNIYREMIINNEEKDDTLKSSPFKK